MTGTSTLEVYDADILVAETGMIVCSMQVIKCVKRQRQRRRQRHRERPMHHLFCSTEWVPLASSTRAATKRLAIWDSMTRSSSSQ